MKHSLLLATVLFGVVVVVAQASTNPAHREVPARSVGAVRVVDAVLARQEVLAALDAGGTAHRAALASRRAGDLIEAGDASRRMGEVAGDRTAGEPASSTCPRSRTLAGRSPSTRCSAWSRRPPSWGTASSSGSRSGSPAT